ncbi:MAG: MBL fold metallo-hydrolase [Clostridia bacterium]|nr:MBL fold metallo-hydrolase [Clostridia bacterium]
MKICTIASGSSGNSTFISDGETSVLVDAGINAKRIGEALADIGEAPENLSALLITHEHSDHISGAGVIARRYKIPIYANVRTMDALVAMKITHKIEPGKLIVFENGVDFIVGTMVVKAFSIPHDAVDPVGFSLTGCGGTKISVSTDMGCVTEEVMKNILGSAAVVLEANHDLEMLRTGPYPYYLKKRILGKSGHLCNDDAATVAERLAASGTKRIILGHLSSENNLPEKALEAVTAAVYGGGKTSDPGTDLADNDPADNTSGCMITVAPRFVHGEVFLC